MRCWIGLLAVLHSIHLILYIKLFRYTCKTYLSFKLFLSVLFKSHMIQSPVYLCVTSVCGRWQLVFAWYVNIISIIFYIHQSYACTSMMSLSFKSYYSSCHQKRIFSSVNIVFVYVSFAGAMVTKVHNGFLITTANGHCDCPISQERFNRFYSYVI